MEKLNVIIVGSTGMVGRGVLLECMDSHEVESVMVINRNPIDIMHPKVSEVIVKDFSNLDSVREVMKGFNTCFYSLGITSVGATEADYIYIMHDLTLMFARQVLALNPEMTFCFVSGAGTDNTEKGKTMWARVKGRTENDLLKLGFKNAYMFRPGLIRPLRGITSRTKWYNVFYTLTKPLAFLFKRMPNYVTDTVTLGRAMINVVLHGYPKPILESKDINIIGSNSNNGKS